MRSLVSDEKYFTFLNGLDDDILAHTELAAVCLIREFPHLRAEEAKAIWQDWRMSKRAPWKGRAGQLAIRQTAIRPIRQSGPICEGRVTDEEKLASVGP